MLSPFFEKALRCGGRGPRKIPNARFRDTIFEGRGTYQQFVGIREKANGNVLDTAGPLRLPTGAEGRQPGEPASVGGKGDLMESAEAVGIGIQGEEVGKLASLLQTGIAGREVRGKRPGQDLQGLRSGKDDTSVIAMVP